VDVRLGLSVVVDDNVAETLSSCVGVSDSVCVSDGESESVNVGVSVPVAVREGESVTELVWLVVEDVLAECVTEFELDGERLRVIERDEVGDEDIDDDELAVTACVEDNEMVIERVWETDIVRTCVLEGDGVTEGVRVEVTVPDELVESGTVKDSVVDELPVLVELCVALSVNDWVLVRDVDSVLDHVCERDNETVGSDEEVFVGVNDIDRDAELVSVID